jgi:hypothetical protein
MSLILIKRIACKYIRMTFFINLAVVLQVPRVHVCYKKIAQPHSEESGRCLITDN